MEELEGKLEGKPGVHVNLEGKLVNTRSTRKPRRKTSKHPEVTVNLEGKLVKTLRKTVNLTRHDDGKELNAPTTTSADVCTRTRCTAPLWTCAAINYEHCTIVPSAG